MAPAYDEFNSRYMYERWTGRLLEKARECGLKGERLLDVGCGTGLSFIAMLDRGFTVTASDISPAMIERAREKAGERVELLVADMREMPELGEFDLVWAVNDAINYLLDEEELVAALEGMRRNLAPDGIVLFDVNTISSYRTFFSEKLVVEEDGKRMHWRGQASGETVRPGEISEAEFEVEGEEGTKGVHRQRHFTEAEVLASLEAAGLESLGVFGEFEGDLDPRLEEDRHTKAVYVARAGR